jgi:hypothetical protein
VVESRALAELPDKWVQLEFKLLMWRFMDFSIKVRASTHNYSLKVHCEYYDHLSFTLAAYLAFDDSNACDNATEIC